MTRSSGTAAAPARLRRRPMPTWLPPMLATLTEELPRAGKWLYEPKLDTSAGLLRHPRFIGLRDDKPAREVRRED